MNMVVSTAFGELAGILECFEASDAEVTRVSIIETGLDDDDELVADLRVEVPVLCDLEFCQDVAVTLGDTDLSEEPLEVALSVSVPVGEAGSPTISLHSVGSSQSMTGGGKSNGTPVYKDPESLQAVYERYGTFTEMTEALGVDVSSETVRRYMVQYGIHDPDGGEGGERSDDGDGGASDQSDGDQLREREQFDHQGPQAPESTSAGQNQSGGQNQTQQSFH